MTDDDVDSELKESIFEDGSIVKVSKPAECLPAGGRFIDEFEFVAALPQTSTHEVFIYCGETDDGEIKNYIYKPNNTTESIRSVLEAISAAFSRLYVPENTVKAFAVYDRNYHCLGLFSEEIPDFKPSSVDGLRASDFQYIDQDWYPVPAMETLCHLFTGLDDKMKSLERQRKKLDLAEKEICDYKCQSIEEVNKNKADMRVIEDRKSINYSEMGEVRIQMLVFEQEMEKVHSITPHKFDSYRALKGHGAGFAAVLLNRDADFHFNNFTRYGLLFDWDMTRWKRLSKFKGMIDKYFRWYYEAMFRLSEYDYTHTPNLKNAKPPFWPTSEKLNLSSDSLRQLPTFDFSPNVYPKEKVKLYRRLEGHPIFFWHWQATFLRHLLVTPEMYKTVILQHINADQSSDKLIHEMLDDEEHVLAWMQKLLVRIPVFREFFKHYGEYVLERYLVFLQAEKIHDCAMVERRFASLKTVIEAHAAKDDADAALRQGVGMSDFHAMKKLTIEEMNNYPLKTDNPSFTNGFGFFHYRHHVRLSEEIVRYCEKMISPDPRDVEGNILALRELYQYLNEKKDAIPPGTMQITLDELTDKIARKLERHKAKVMSPFSNSI